MIIFLVDSHYNCVKDKGYLASLWQPAISCSAWLCGLLIRVIMHSRAMITPVLITSENIIMAMVSHIKITSPLWYNSDLTRSLHLHTVSQLRPGATVWKKLREASFLFWRSKNVEEKNLVNHFIINLLTFCKPIKNFEDRNLDNINILYNFTRQKEGSLKSELGSPLVHNLYRMVSGKFMLLSQLMSLQCPIF